MIMPSVLEAKENEGPQLESAWVFSCGRALSLSPNKDNSQAVPLEHVGCATYRHLVQSKISCDLMTTALHVVAIGVSWCTAS